MLYRRYRPQKFSEVISSSHIASAISNALYKGDPAHAFFLYGSRGIGKTTTARLLAKALNCENPVIDPKAKIPFEPCGECPSCKAMENGVHLDLIEIDAASNRGIDSIRELIDKVKLSPAMGKRKVYIIDEVHMLTNEASNALLKTLEEPPEHAFFILCTTNPEKVLDTIKSRCQQFVFKKPSITEIQEKIDLILKSEKKEVSQDIISKIASSAKGAFRDAETLLEQILSKGEGDFAFGMDYADYVEFLAQLHSKDVKKSLQVVYKLLANESNAETLVENYVEFLRNVMLHKLGIKDALGVYEVAYLAQEKELTKVDINLLKNAIYQFSKSMEDFKYVAISSLPLEMAVINLCETQDNSTSSAPTKENSPSKNAPTVSNPTNNSPIGSGVVKSVPLSVPPKPSTMASATSSAPVAVVTEVVDIIVEPVSQSLVDVLVLEEEANQPIVHEAKLEEIKSSVKYPREFPFKKMVVQLKETHHSIYLILGTAVVESFTEGTLKIRVPYSFHKERLLNSKIRTAVEEAATNLIGAKVVVECDLISSSKEAKSLTDQNIKLPKNDVPLEKVFEDVFGDDIVG